MAILHPVTGNIAYTITYTNPARTSWKSTLPPVEDVAPEDFAWCALMNLAMVFSPAAELESKDVRIQVAGAVIRRWRRSLKVKSKREEAPALWDKYTPEELVAGALRMVTLAMHAKDPKTAAGWLRMGEAQLRERHHRLRRLGTTTTTTGVVGPTRVS